MQKSHPVAKQLPEYLESLWRFSYRLTQNQDTARELTQKTCLRALEYQSYYKDGNLKSWLFKIMHNLWRDEIRKNARNGLKLVSTDCDTIVAPARSEDPEQQALLSDVQHLTDALPEAQRTVLLLVAVEGFSYRETAELLELPIGTIMSRLARARASIGQLINQSGTENKLSNTKVNSCKK